MRQAIVQRSAAGKSSAAAAAPFVPAPAEFLAADIVSYWNRGLLTLGAPARYDSFNADGHSYTQNYSYSLTYLGRQIGVLHVHYNTDDPAAVSTAVIGQIKLKRSDFGALLDRGAPAGMIATARAKHPAPVAAAPAAPAAAVVPVCPNCGGPH